MIANIKATPLHKNKLQVKLSVFSCSFLCSWLVLYSPCVLPDITADGNSTTSIVTSPNGVPVVDIATPSAGGVSHNTFETFNVDLQGVVINNSLVNGTSALAGAVSANANFKKQSANIILNEVTSTNRSNLLGTTEIFGDNASYILANPNGITCNGCGFIRTPTALGDGGGLREVILSTSDALELSGNDDLDFLSIGINSTADILIGPGGLDIGNVDVTTLFTRKLNIDGLISAANNRLQMLLGTGTLDFDAVLPEDRTFTATQSDDGLVTVAIDASVAGAMNAGQIYIMATEDGVGVTLDNTLIASAGNIELTANGDIVYRNINASDSFNVTTNLAGTTLTTTGTTVASNDINWNLAGDALVDSGAAATITAGGNFTVDCTNGGCDLTSQDSLSINAAQLNTNANIISTANKALSINANLNSTANIQSGDTLSITSSGASSTGNITATGAITVNSAILSAGEIQTGDTVSINTVGSTTTANIIAQSTVDIDAATIKTENINSGGRLELSATAGDITTGTLTATNTVAINTQASGANLITNGINSGGDVSWQLNGQAQLAGNISAANSINFNCTTPGCTVSSDNALQLDGQNLNTQANIQTANNRDLTINANLQSSADISSGNRLHINASNGDIISSGALSANQAIELTSAAGGNIDIAGLITSGADFIINGGGNYTHNNTENLNIAGDWVIDTHSLTNNDTIITSDLQNNVFRVDEFHNNGLFQSDGPLTLQVDDLLNNNGIITSLEGVIKINHSQAEGNTGTINNNGIINAISLSQQQQPENTLIINPQSIIDNYVADILAGKQRTSQDLINDINTANQETLSQLTAGTGELGSLQINAGILNNNETAQISATQVALNVDALNNHGGLITAAKNIAINGNTLSNSNTTDIFGVITARDNIDITLNNQFDNEGIIEANDIVIDAPIQNNNSGMVLSGLTGQNLSTSSNLASTSSQLWFTMTQGSDNYYQYGKALDNDPLIDSNLTQLTDAFLAASATNLNGLPVAGDDLFLAELISNTIRENGDDPFITDDRNSLAQLSTLYSNTLAFMDASDLNSGQLPTATQRQQMAAPILVFQQQSLPNGDVMLAPTILLPNAELNTSILAADQINSSILAHNNLLLKGEQITNSGDLIAGNNLIIDTVDLALTTSERNWFINENGEVQYHSAVISAPSLAVSISGNYVQKGGQLITENPLIIEANNIDISGATITSNAGTNSAVTRTAQATIEIPDTLYLLAQQRINIGENALLKNNSETLLSAGSSLEVNGVIESGRDLTLLGQQIRVGDPAGDKNQVASTSLLAQGNILLQSQTHIDLGYADITAGHTQNTHEPENTETQTGDITAGIMLLAQDGYINSQYTTLNAGADIYMSASDDINSRNTLLSSNNTFQQATNINLLRTTINNTESTSLIASNNLLTKNSNINSGDLNLFADNGNVTVNQSQLTANGDMTLSANNNDVLLSNSNLQANTNTTKDSLINENLAVEQQPHKSGNLTILADKGDIINTAGSLSAQNSGFMKAGGNIINRSTQTVVDKKTKYNRKIITQKTHVNANYDDESIPAHDIIKTTVTDTKVEGQYVDSRIASINTGDGGLTQIAGGDIVNEGGKVKSSGNIFQQAEGSIKNTTLTKRFTKNKTTRVTTSKETTGLYNHNRQSDNTTTRRGILSYKTEGIAALTATTGAGGNLTQIAGKDIINDAGKLIAGKDIYQQAEGNIKNLSKDIAAYNNIGTGLALSIGKRNRTIIFNRTIPGAKRLYTASTSAGGNLIVKAEKGAYTNTGNISAGKDIDISAKDIINTRLTRKLGNLQNTQAKEVHKFQDIGTATITTTTGRQQVLDTGRVTAGGNIILNASNKITDTAGRYRAGTKGPLTDAEGNVRHDDNGNTLKGGIYADAKNGITFNDIKWTERDQITETKSYLRYDYDGDVDGRYTVSNDIGYNTRDKVVTGNLRSDGHTSLKSEKGDLNLTGTDIAAGQRIALEGRNIKLEAISKKQEQYRHQGRTITQDYTIKNDVVNLNAKDGITFTTTGNKKAGQGNLTTQGAKLNAGKDATDNVIMNIIGNTNLDGVNDEVYSYYKHTKKKSFGRSKTTIIESHDVTLNETEINGGGNLLVNIAFDEIGQPVGRDSGTVTMEGTNINMGQNAIIYGEDGVNVLSGIEYSFARKEVHKKGVGGLSSSGSTSIVEQQRLGHAQITTGGDTVLLSKNNINVVAGKLTANNIIADAGFGLSDEEREAAKSEGNANVNIIGDEEALASFDHKYKRNIKLSVKDDFLSVAEDVHKKDWKTEQNTIGSVLNARQDINLRAASDINVIGSELSAANNIKLKADNNVNILAALDSAKDKTETSREKIGFEVKIDSNGINAFAGREQRTITDKLDVSGVKASLLQAGNNISIKAAGYINQQGSDVIAFNDVNYNADGAIRLDTATATETQQHTEFLRRDGISTGLQHNFDATRDAVSNIGKGDNTVSKASTTLQAIDSVSNFAAGPAASAFAGSTTTRSSETSTSELARGSSVQAGGNVTLNAGTDIDVVGSAIVAALDIDLSAENVSISAIENQFNQSASFSTDQSGVVMSGQKNSASIGLSDSYSKQRSNQQTASSQSSLLSAGNNANITAKNDIKITGSDINADNNIAFDAGRDVLIQAHSTNTTTKVDGNSGGGEVGIAATVGPSGAALGVYGSANVAKNNLDRDGTDYRNSQLTAGNTLSITSGRDATLRGANAEAEHVELDVGRDFTLASIQDTGHVDGIQKDANVRVVAGAGVSVSGSVGYGETSGSKAWVNQQTSLIARDKLDVKVKGHTQIDGAVLASETDNLNLDTNTLGYSDIKDHDKETSSYLNIGISGSSEQGSNPAQQQNNIQTGIPTASGQQKDGGGGYGFTISGNASSTDREQINRATIGKGNITVRNDAVTGNDSIAGINRDTTKAQEITKDESSNTQIYASDSSINSVLNPYNTVQQWGKDLAQYDESAFEAIDSLVRSTEYGIDVGNAIGALFSGESLSTAITEGRGAIANRVAAWQVTKYEQQAALTLKNAEGKSPEEIQAAMQILANTIADLSGTDKEIIIKAMLEDTRAPSFEGATDGENIYVDFREGKGTSISDSGDIANVVGHEVGHVVGANENGAEHLGSVAENAWQNELGRSGLGRDTGSASQDAAWVASNNNDALLQANTDDFQDTSPDQLEFFCGIGADCYGGDFAERFNSAPVANIGNVEDYQMLVRYDPDTKKPIGYIAYNQLTGETLTMKPAEAMTFYNAVDLNLDDMLIGMRDYEYITGNMIHGLYEDGYVGGIVDSHITAWQNPDFLGDVAASVVLGGASRWLLGAKGGLSAARSKNKSVVLGEGMADIKIVAKELQLQGVDAKWYQAWNKNFPKNRPMTPEELMKATQRNERWINTKIKEGYDFYDIGIDPTRSVRSPFYQLEQKAIKETGTKTIQLDRPK